MSPWHAQKREGRVLGLMAANERPAGRTELSESVTARSLGFLPSSRAGPDWAELPPLLFLFP